MARARASEEALTPARFAIALVLAAPLLVLGCGKDDPPTKPKPAEPFVYPNQSTPEGTLLRLAAAFSRRDTVMTDSVYANDYEGTSQDLIDPSPVNLTFTKSDEIKVVRGMAMASLTYVNFDLYSQATWPHVYYASDPPDWITIQIPYFKIEVRGASGDGYTARSPSAGETWLFEFTLRPTTPSPTSPTDTTWSVVRWAESRSF